MADKLSLYNGALRNLNERPLATLTDPVKSRRELDRVFDGAVKFCLEQGYWNFATRTAKFTPEVGFVAAFGYKNQFLNPADYLRLAAICHDEYFQSPNNSFTEEAGSWYSDSEELYVSYISNDANYGLNYSRWPESFTNYVEMYLASQVAGVLTGDKDKVPEDELRRAMVNAKSKDAMNEPAKFLPPGQFTSARRGSRNNDRGSRSRLIG
jgi:hypothetical protein